VEEQYQRDVCVNISVNPQNFKTARSALTRQILEAARVPAFLIGFAA
jgi:hypothetical protein